MNPGYPGYGQNPTVTRPGTAPAVRGGTAVVFGMLAFSFLFSVLGGVAGTIVAASGGIGTIFFILLFVAQLALLFTLRPIAARSAPLGLVALYGFTFLSGFSLAPVILSYTNAGLLGIVGQALGLTAILTVGLTAFAMTTTVSLARFGTWLFIGLLGLIGASFLAIFVQATILQIAIGAGGAILFSLFLVYDVQKVRNQSGDFANAVVLTASVYLDIVNLFLSLLRLLTAFSGGGGRRN